MNPYVAVARGLALADHAVELDPTLAEAYLARADALLISLAPHDQVLRSLREARQLAPGNVSVYLSVAHALEHMGRWEAALQQAQRGLALDPLSTGVRHSAIAIALGARRYDLAVEEARRARAFDANDRVAEMLLGNALLLKGEAEECAKLGLEPWLATKAICLHESGREAEGKVLADSLERLLTRGDYAIVPQFVALAAYRAWLGDARGAVAWLERSAQVSPMLHYWYLESGLFDRVRSDTVFSAGVARVESADPDPGRRRAARDGRPARVSGPSRSEVKWDIASPELLKELIDAPPPGGLRLKRTSHGFHRDIYYDTADGSLARRDVTCRFRLGADDRRVMTVALASPRQRFSSAVTELDLAAALRGESEPARRLRGLVDPANLEPLLELEVERESRILSGAWPWSARYELVYDIVTVRHDRPVARVSGNEARAIASGTARSVGRDRRYAAGVGDESDPGEQTGAGAAPRRDAGGRGAGPVARVPGAP